MSTNTQAISDDIIAAAKKSADALITRMCVTMDHSFGLQSEEEQRGLRTSMTQLAEHDIAPAIAKAIHDAVMAERERCAGIAEYFAQACVCADWPDDARGASYYACGDVASAIRNDTPPKQPSLPTSDDDLPF